MRVHTRSHTPPAVWRTFVLFVQLDLTQYSFSTKPADVFLLQTTSRGLVPTWEDGKQNTSSLTSWTRAVYWSESNVCQTLANAHKLDLQEILICRWSPYTSSKVDVGGCPFSFGYRYFLPLHQCRIWTYIIPNVSACLSPLYKIVINDQ